MTEPKRLSNDSVVDQERRDDLGNLVGVELSRNQFEEPIDPRAALRVHGGRREQD